MAILPSSPFTSPMQDRAPLRERIYTPEARHQSLRTSIGQMREDFLQGLPLAWRLFQRDFSAQYRQSFLGYIWTVLPPMLTFGVFLILKRSGAVNIGDTVIPYAAYVLFGMAAWEIFGGGLVSVSQAINSSANLVAKISFPREMLLFSAYGKVLFKCLIQSILVTILFIALGVSVKWTVIFLPILLLFMILFTMGLGFVLSIAQALFNDTSNFLSISMKFLMLSAPVVYPMPTSYPYTYLNVFNPLSIFIIAARDLTTKGSLSNPIGICLVCGLSLLMFFVGWRIFQICISLAVEKL